MAAGDGRLQLLGGMLTLFFYIVIITIGHIKHKPKVPEVTTPKVALSNTAGSYTALVEASEEV